METIKHQLRGRLIAPALKKFLKTFYPEIVVKVRTVGPSYNKRLMLEWIDGPSKVTMQRAVLRFMKENNVDRSSWVELERNLSMQGELFFARAFEAQTGLSYEHDKSYEISYDPEDNLFIDDKESRFGYQLSYRWALFNELPVY